MGIFVNCKNCGERIELILSKNKKRVPYNIEPSIIVNAKKELVQARLSHFTTCCKCKDKGNGTLHRT